MRASRIAILTAVLALTAALASAQTWTITVQAGDKVTSSDLQTGKVNMITSAQATVQVLCDTGVVCTGIGLQLENNGAVTTKLTGTPISGGMSFTVPASAVASTGQSLVVTDDGDSIATFLVGTVPGTGGTTTSASTTSPASTTSAGSVSLADLLTVSCPGQYTARYDEKGNHAQIVVTPLGQVLASAVQTFDENDDLEVTVVGDSSLLPLLLVQRTSAIRDRTVVNVVGGNVTSIPLIRQACGSRTFLLSDFAPGEATVQISVLQGTTPTQVGGFNFIVDPLYTGMFTLGAAQSNLVDPAYKLASNGTETVIAAGNTGNHDLLYTLFYTPFVWGKRDLQKSVPWYQHLNPSLGVVPGDVSDNALIGVSADLPAGIVITVGEHFGRITTLPSSTGLTVGSPFTGTADQLPTAQSWENDTFFAVTVDLRVMVQFLKLAIGSSAGGS
jgi:hypothetical protein